MTIEARGIFKTLDGAPVLSDVALDVEPGEVLGLIGPNGAGKTTLLRILAGLLPPDRGDVTYAGRNLKVIGRSPLATEIAYLAQGDVAHWDMTVQTIVGLGRLPHGTQVDSFDEDDRAIDEALRLTGTSHLALRGFDTLSGGERKRVLLARALAVQAATLLVDEPIASLDPRHQLEVLEILRGIARQGRSVVLVLHDLTLAARFCDRLLMLNDGRVTAQGTPDQVLDDRLIEQTFGIVVVRGVHEGRPYVLPWTAMSRRQ